MHTKSLQLCPTLCNPMDCSPPGSSVDGILQAKHWSGLSCPPSGDLSDPRIKAASSAGQADALPLRHLGNPDIEIQGSIYRFLMFKG